MPLLGDPVALITIIAALALGGLLKGVIGMGAPVVAVPIMSAFIDVRLAVVIMVVPNLVTNLWQLWAFRHALLRGWFTPVNTIASGVGAIIGTWFLVGLPVDVLTICVAGAVIAYVALRLFHPDFALSMSVAQYLAAPAGIAAGILQGAAGISAPVSVSFLNAIKINRETFIATISAGFVGMSLIQVPMLVGYGFLNLKVAAVGILCLIPLFLFMRLGGLLAQNFSPAIFDRAILIVLSLLATRLIWSVI